MISRTTTRRARKPRRCDGCKGRIEPGQLYASHVAFPGHIDNVGFWRLCECADCCERYGRPLTP